MIEADDDDDEYKMNRVENEEQTPLQRPKKKFNLSPRWIMWE